MLLYAYFWPVVKLHVGIILAHQNIITYNKMN